MKQFLRRYQKFTHALVITLGLAAAGITFSNRAVGASRVIPGTTMAPGAFAGLVQILAEATRPVSDPKAQVKRLQVGRLVTSVLQQTPPVTTTGKCNGEIVCPQCNDACATFKIGMALVEVMQSVNDDGSLDDTIQRIEDYIFGALNDFGCTCSSR